MSMSTSNSPSNGTALVTGASTGIGASKAYVIALSHSLQHELADKGVRIQAVLPGAVATDFWEIPLYIHSTKSSRIVRTHTKDIF